MAGFYQGHQRRLNFRGNQRQAAFRTAERRERLPEVFAEFYRILAPGGYLQLGFQVRDESSHLSQALGHEVSLDFQPRQPDLVTRLLSAAGFVLRARMLREPDEKGEFTERTQQAFLLARKPPVAPNVT